MREALICNMHTEEALMNRHRRMNKFKEASDCAAHSAATYKLKHVRGAQSEMHAMMSSPRSTDSNQTLLVDFIFFLFSSLLYLYVREVCKHANAPKRIECSRKDYNLNIKDDHIHIYSAICFAIVYAGAYFLNEINEFSYTKKNVQ